MEKDNEKSSRVLWLVLCSKQKKKNLISSLLRFLSIDKGKRDIRYPHRKISSAEQRERKLKW